MSIHPSREPPTLLAESGHTGLVTVPTGTILIMPPPKPETIEFETSDIEIEWVVIKEDIQMDENKVEEILRHYTPEQQTVKAIEELAELQTELARILNKQGNEEALKGELADVYIMILQMMIIYDIDPEELESEMEYKLDRQIQRIRKEKTEDGRD